MSTGLFALGQQGAEGQQPTNPLNKYKSPLTTQINDMASGLFAIGQKQAATPYNYDSAPKMMDTSQMAAERQRLESGLYSKSEQDLNRRYAQEEEQFRAQLANQGLDAGSQKYNRQLEDFRRAKDAAYNDAKFQSMMFGGQETDRMFQQSLQGRQQAISEQDSLRDRPFKEMAALLDPAAKFAALESQEAIAAMDDETARYGVDRDFEASRYSTDKGFESSKYATDKGFEASQLGIASQEKIAADRAQLDRDLQAGRITSEEKIAAEQNLIQQQLQAERIAADNAALEKEQGFLQGEKKKDRRFEKGQNSKDRQIQMAQIRAAAAKAAGGGGGEALDPATLAALIDALGGA